MRGRFAVLSLRRDYFLVVSSTNIHDTDLNTQLRYVYIDISIIEIDAQTDMSQSREFKKCIFHFYFLNIDISLTIIV